jgi:hypothetical protein
MNYDCSQNKRNRHQTIILGLRCKYTTVYLYNIIRDIVAVHEPIYIYIQPFLGYTRVKRGGSFLSLSGDAIRYNIMRVCNALMSKCTGHCTWIIRQVYLYNIQVGGC